MDDKLNESQEARLARENYDQAAFPTGMSPRVMTTPSPSAPQEVPQWALRAAQEVKEIANDVLRRHADAGGQFILIGDAILPECAAIITQHAAALTAENEALREENRRMKNNTDAGYVFNQMRKAWEALGEPTCEFKPHKFVGRCTILRTENERLKAELAEAKSQWRMSSVCRELQAENTDLREWSERAREAMEEAQKDADNMLAMIEDYERMDWGADGPPFTPCIDELRERIESRDALLATYPASTGRNRTGGQTMTIYLTVEVFTSDGCAPLYEDAQHALRNVIERAELTWNDPSLGRVISAGATVTSTEPGTP